MFDEVLLKGAKFQQMKYSQTVKSSNLTQLLC